MSEVDDLKEIFNVADLGQECRKFLQTPIGRYILERAIEVEDHAKSNLLTVDAEDVKTIRKLQEEARVPNRLFVWINDAILKGENAEAVLQGELNDE